MWYLIQHNPNDIATVLGSYRDYERAEFVMINKQRFLSHCKFEVVHYSKCKEILGWEPLGAQIAPFMATS